LAITFIFYIFFDVKCRVTAFIMNIIEKNGGGYED